MSYSTPDWLIQSIWCCYFHHADKVQESLVDLQDSSTTSSPADVHVADEGPGITLWIIHFNAAQTIGTVESSNHVDLLIDDGSGWPGTRIVHWCNVGPLVCQCVVPRI